MNATEEQHMGLNMSGTVENPEGRRRTTRTPRVPSTRSRFFYRVRRAGDRWTVSAWRDTPAVAVPVARRVSYREVLAVLARARRRSAQAG